MISFYLFLGGMYAKESNSTIVLYLFNVIKCVQQKPDSPLTRDVGKRIIGHFEFQRVSPFESVWQQIIPFSLWPRDVKEIKILG